jgi:hypothetical protein
MDAGPSSLELRTKEAAGYSTVFRLEPMPRESVDALGLGPTLDTMLPRYSAAAGPACRCVVCESDRAARLTQALHNKFDRGLAYTDGRNR